MIITSIEARQALQDAVDNKYKGDYEKAAKRIKCTSTHLKGVIRGAYSITKKTLVIIPEFKIERKIVRAK